ncbi:hypothetical protein KFK09_024018 [Dendrobium nobile]|uniref:Uncharacterized protein n=1 Tax=Dendrobium nobile TaxID=94219 RepID=A0A8T3ACU9_DENNO|nr:hypothetical protein KFK09_024018 [Dendrobium nobile]
MPNHREEFSEAYLNPLKSKIKVFRSSTFRAAFSKRARDPFFSLKMGNEGNENFTA